MTRGLTLTGSRGQGALPPYRPIHLASIQRRHTAILGVQRSEFEFWEAFFLLTKLDGNTSPYCAVASSKPGDVVVSSSHNAGNVNPWVKKRFLSKLIRSTSVVMFSPHAVVR